MENNEKIHIAMNEVIQCRFCSWRSAERFECTREERRIIKPNELPTPSWCPLRGTNDTHGTDNIKEH
jgi:hypothetical protein